MPVPASSARTTFQVALASLSDRANAENGAVGGGSKARSSTSSAGRGASKQEKAQSTSGVSDESAASATVPPVDQKPAPVQDSLGGQASADRTGDGSATPVAADLQFLNASPDLSRQIAAQAVSAGAATTEQQPNVAADGDKDADGVAQADAQTAATAAGTAAEVGAGVVTPVSGENFKLQIELPMAAAPAGKADGVQPVGKAGQKNAVDAAGSKNSDLTNTTDADKADSGKSKAADAVGAVAVAPSHSAQSNGQSMQHAQPDASQAAGVVQKVVDSGAAQAQAVPMHAAIHSAANTPGTPSGVQDGVRPGVDRQDMGSSPLDGDEATPTSGINAAKLIQTLSETEMRVGMHSAEFGNISIRTSVSQQQMLAQISLDHGDLSQAISDHISSVQAKLGNDYGLQTLIQVNHQGASSSGEQGSSPQREQRAFASSARAESAAVPAELDVGMSLGALASAGDGYRLDIRA
jgi:hypothetical protein